MRLVNIEEKHGPRLARRLFALQDAISLKQNEALVGRTVEVLIDGTSRKDPAVRHGRTGDNKVVNLAVPETYGIGSLVPVRITRAHAHSLFGELVAQPNGSRGVSDGH